MMATRDVGDDDLRPMTPVTPSPAHRVLTTVDPVRAPLASAFPCLQNAVFGDAARDAVFVFGRAPNGALSLAYARTDSPLYDEKLSCPFPPAAFESVGALLHACDRGAGSVYDRRCPWKEEEMAKKTFFRDLRSRAGRRRRLALY